MTEMGNNGKGQGCGVERDLEGLGRYLPIDSTKGELRKCLNVRQGVCRCVVTL